MRIVKFYICSLFILAASACTDEQTGGEYFTTLDKSLSKEAVNTCSRRSYEIDGAWNPLMQDIQKLENSLDMIEDKINATVRLLDTPSSMDDYYRQYSGIILGDKKLIYINAVHKQYIEHESIELFREWQNKVVGICDGGAYFWGAIYNPENKSFDHIAFNGQ